jgi:hypothetical protein
MKKALAIALTVLLSVAPSVVLAKGATTKIVIEGPDLSKPIEISDPKVLAHFNVWAGPGTSSTRPGFNANAPSFIIAWSQGPIAHLPEALQKYQVTFYSEERSGRPIYVVIMRCNLVLVRDTCTYPGRRTNGGSSTLFRLYVESRASGSTHWTLGKT